METGGLGRGALMATGAAAAGAAIGLGVWTARTGCTAEESVTAVRRRPISRPMVITGTLVHSLDVSTLEVGLPSPPPPLRSPLRIAPPYRPPS